MKFKEGDIVKLNKRGMVNLSEFFKDNVYSGLEIASVSEGDDGYWVWTNDKSKTVFAYGESLELDMGNDHPSTWKRNTPVFINKDNAPRHFAYYEDGKCYYYPFGKTSHTYPKDKKPHSLKIENIRKATAEELQ
jgi:hypothetical protein